MDAPPDVASAPGHRFTWESLTTSVFGLGMAFAALPSLMISNPPLITYSDVFLFLGLVMVMPRLFTGRLSASPLYLIGALSLLCMALISFAFVPQAGQVQGILRISYALVVLPCAFLLWRPPVTRIAVMAACYVVGTTVSVLYGIGHGPGGDGRNLGLTLHPNGLGHTALVSIALVPFLTAMYPSGRWVVRFAGLVCVYGIWISGSRGSLIGLVLVALVYVLIERSATAALFGWGLSIVFVLAWPRFAHEDSNNVLTRVLGGGTSGDATGQRLVALHQALDQVNAHPFLGNGFGTIRAAQDAYLQVLAALGIFGLIGFVLILLALTLPVLTSSEPLRLLSYTAAAYMLLAPFTDSVSDTLIWAPLSLCILARRVPGQTSATPDAKLMQSWRPPARTPADASGSRDVPGTSS